MHGEEKVCVKREGSLITSGLERLAQKSYQLYEIKDQLRNHAVLIFGSEFVDDRCGEPLLVAKTSSVEEPSVLEAISILNDKFDRSINEIGMLLEILKTNV